MYNPEFAILLYHRLNIFFSKLENNVVIIEKYKSIKEMQLLTHMQG